MRNALSAAVIALFLLALPQGNYANAQLGPPSRPLIFVPGIFGTKLCRAFGQQTLVWGALNSFRYFSELRLNNPTDATRLRTCGELDEFVYFGPLGQDVYKPFLQRLTASGYERGKNLFVFEYDWRLSSFDNADRLANFVEAVIRDARLPSNTRFDILAHSLGGIIATIYANEVDVATTRIARLVTVGTPFAGSVRVLESLDSGWGKVPKLYVSMPDVRKTVLSFPSIYELLPRYPNCCAFGPPGRQSRFEPLSSQAWLRTPWAREVGLTPETLNSHFDRVKRLDLILAKPPRVFTRRLIGSQRQTPEQIYFVEGADADANRAIHLIKRSWVGDGTVLALSATGGKQPDHLPGMIAHDRLMSDDKIMEQLQWFLLARFEWPKDIAGSQTSVSAKGGEIVAIDGVGVEAPQRLTGPNDPQEIYVTLKSSSPQTRPGVLREVVLYGSVVDARGESRRFALEAIGDVDTGIEDNHPYLAARFRGIFDAPAIVGHAAVEIRFSQGKKDPDIAWDFGVVQ